MLCEPIKSKIPTHHKDTPRQHSLKQILLLVRLLILSLFPCNKGSENLLQKKYVRNLWVLGYTPILQKLSPKENRSFSPTWGTIPKTSTRFFGFFATSPAGANITAVHCRTCPLVVVCCRIGWP